MADYVAPDWEKDAFNCPHCDAYAMQDWYPIQYIPHGRMAQREGWLMAICSRCGQNSMWFQGRMIFPSSAAAPLPHPDMPENVAGIYGEARNIFSSSPRGAAALLRLALQELCVDLGEKGKNINDDIKELVKKGLPVGIQQALDVVRVVGNHAVHPGEISLEDSPEVAGTLFELVNFIVEQMISQPKKLAELYDGLPAGAREAIKKRDGEAS